MVDIDSLGKITNYNPDTNEIIFKYEYLSIEDLQSLETLIESKTRIKAKFLGKIREGKQRRHQKAWYGTLGVILKYMNILPNSSNMAVFDEEMRKNLFPVKYVIIDGKRLPKVARMADMTSEQLDERIGTLQERYSYLKDANGRPIDFSDLRS